MTPTAQLRPIVSKKSAMMMFLQSYSTITTLLAVAGVATAANMNAGPYKIANSLSYKTDYHEHEFFQVYSPMIRTRYSEVFWKSMDPVAIPQDIQERFSSNIMAITGYEVDQVRTTETGEEVSVPITWAYNHHYGAFLYNSNKAKLVKRKMDANKTRWNHGSDEYWTAELRTSEPRDGSSIDEMPLLTMFSEANGGEFRLSYHGYPRGYAQLVESPDTFHFVPMQIDTWNRSTRETKFHPGPLPKNSRIPKNAGYNGLIECPCSNAMVKEWNMTYGLVLENDSKKSGCTGEIQNASECFLGARQVVQAQKHVDRTVSDPSKPSGCSVEQHLDGTVDAVWNTVHGSIIAEKSNELVAFSHAQVNVTVALDDTTDTVTITMVGPKDRWFGVAFGTSTMCVHLVSDECPGGGPYAIVVRGNTVEERKLDFHGAGRILEPSVIVKSMSVSSGGNRTVVLTRPLQGASSDHYTFDSSTRSLPIITARGCGLEFAQHCGHGPSELNFLAVDTPTRICQTGIEGTIGGDKFDKNRCADFPYSDLVDQHNPTCSIETYRGGLSCCRDGKSLLDKDQEIPWPDDYIEYRFKFRFYFQDYHPAVPNVRPASHENLVRLYWQTEYSAGEYDVEQCHENVPRDQCIHAITARWKVRDMLRDCSIRPDSSWCTGKGTTDSDKTEGVQLIYAGPHCHAPSCLSMELYNADTGRLLCRMEPIVGETNELYDEEGFLAIPPCLWGDTDEGLPPPELLSLDTTLLSIKRNNSTLPHTGEMASWQMRGIVVPKKQDTESISVPVSFANPMEADSVRRNQFRGAGN